MGAWKDVSKAVRFKTRATAYYLKEKNRRAAVMNRLRAVIRCEEKAAEKEYLALGRYYYNALRDPDNPLAESHCARIDQINARRDSALESLEQASHQEEAASIGFIGGSDGPTAVYKFRFHKGRTEITVTPDEEDAEEVDLSDVECFDYDPTLPQDGPPAQDAASPAGQGVSQSESVAPPTEHEIRPAEHEIRPAELDENDGLPFE